MRRSWMLLCATSFTGIYGKNFTVSDRAWRRISEKNAQDGISNDRRFLRLAIDSGGCHGYVYKFAFEENDALVPDEDVVVAEADVVPSAAQPSPRIVVDKFSISKLESASVDFYSELKGSAFIVVGNELVDHTCACAMSFSVRKGKKTLT